MAAKKKQSKADKKPRRVVAERRARAQTVDEVLTEGATDLSATVEGAATKRKRNRTPKADTTAVDAALSAVRQGRRRMRAQAIPVEHANGGIRRQRRGRAQLAELEAVLGTATTRPDHYGGEDNPFEPIKIILHYNLGFCLGNAIKYTLRSGKKGTRSDAIADFKKAAWYLNKHIAELEASHER